MGDEREDPERKKHGYSAVFKPQGGRVPAYTPVVLSD